MKTTITHNFQYKSHDLLGLFTDTKKFSTFKSKLEKQSLLDPLRYDTNKYLGDGFEFFVELFLYLHPCDNRIGINNYEPNQINDNGVDGICKNIKNEKSVVQIKYRKDSQSQLSSNKDNLSNLFSDGMLNHDVVSDNKNLKNYRHFIFTTANGLNFYTDQEMFKNKVKCFGNEEFRSVLDNNLPFWDACLHIVKSLKNK